MALELFAGSATLSKALRASGFQVFAVDHHVAGAKAPILKVDLSTSEGQSLVWRLIQSDLVAYVHLGVPSGTCTRERARNLLPGLGPSPQPLRSADHPLGLPSLQPGSVSHTRVQKANEVYRFAFQVTLWCAERHVLCSIENPLRARTWNVFQHFAKESPKSLSLWQSLATVDFHECMHGSGRRKRTRLKATPGVFDSLAVDCDGNHTHEPWTVQVASSEKASASSAQTAYPPLLAERLAACVKVALESQRGVRLQPPVKLHDEAVGASHRQHKRHPPLIPEYREVQTLPASATVPANGKLLSLSQIQGVVAAEGPFAQGSVASQSAGLDRKETTSLAVSGEGKVVGLWHTPEEHFKKAISLAHPVDSFKPVAMVTKRAVDYVLGTKPELQKMERKVFLAKLKVRAQELRPKEEELHGQMAPHLRKVLGDKNLLSWRGSL